MAVVAAGGVLSPSSTHNSLVTHTVLPHCCGLGHSAWEGTIAPAHKGQRASVPMTPQLKQMEVQLEEEYEDKQKALREKRELESKLSTLSDQVQLPAPPA